MFIFSEVIITNIESNNKYRSLKDSNMCISRVKKVHVAIGLKYN